LDKQKLDIISCGKNFSKVRRAICSGFFQNAAKKDSKEGFKSLVDEQTVYIHPSSALFQKSPQWVVYHTLVVTSKEYMREITVVDPNWLTEYAPSFYKSCVNKKSASKNNEKIIPLYNRNEDEWRISKMRKII
jgi:ATP-dependent RNA helicase DHX8/PRP22